MSKVALTNYDINKQAYLNLESLSDEDINERLKEVLDWINMYGDWHYMGILSRDTNDYTVIKTNDNFEGAIQEAKEVLKSRGEIVAVEYNSQDYYEVWVRERRTESIAELEEKTPAFMWKPQIWMYIIFDATSWVIEVQEKK